MVYQNLKNITEEKEYWDKYIKFHELYWDGPNASQNVFYGNEYEEYRSSLSKYLATNILHPFGFASVPLPIVKEYFC